MMLVAIQDRFVEVIAEVTVGQGSEARTEWRVASGFLINGRHVLTSLHAVADGEIEVRRAIPWPDGPKRSWRAWVRLRGEVEHADLAVLELAEDTAEEIGLLPMIAFARVADRTERLEVVEGCGAVGFPRFLERGRGPTVVRQAAQIDGRIPISQRPGPGLLTLQTHHRPEDPPLPSAGTTLAGSAWSGMSGAAVLAGDCVIGVVSEHAPRQGASDLTIVPITLIDTLPDCDAWWALLGTGPGRLRTLPAAGGEVWADDGPYQGLAPFGREQAVLFHGRGQATARLQAMVTDKRAGGGLIMVTGASGAGKSSLLHAGLLPALTDASGDPSGCSSWPQVCFTPAERPLQELAIHLAVPSGADPDVVMAELRGDPAQARTRARQALTAEAIRRRQQGGSGQTPQRLIMVVDQFEEMFTSSLRGHAEEVAAFLAALEAIAAPASPPPPGPHAIGRKAAGGQGADRHDQEPAGIVVLAVRGDFIDRCAAHPALAWALEQRAFVLGPMSEPELRRAITGPAAVAGLRLQDGLAEQVVRDLIAHTRATADEAPGGGSVVGALPLLSMAMARTWQHRNDGQLTLHGYDRSGGVASAVQDAAEDAYRDLNPRQQEAAHGVLLALTLIGADGQPVRQRASIGELAARCEPAEPEVARHVVTAFTRARLMVTGAAPPPVTAPAGTPGASGSTAAGGGASSTAAGDPAAELADPAAAGTVELAHDVLLTAWPRLRDWLADEQADRRLHGEICQDATDWAKAGQDASFLYRGTRLETAQHAAAGWHADPDRHLRLPEVATAFLHTGARAATRTRRRRQALVSVLAGLLVIAIIAAITAVRSAQDADRQRTDAERRGAEALSRQLASQSTSLLTTDPGLASLLAIKAYRTSPTAEAIASLGAAADLPLQASFTVGAPVKSVAFHPKDNRILAINSDNGVQLRDVTTGKILRTLTSRAAKSVAFNPAGRILAIAGDNGVQLREVATGKTIRVLPAGKYVNSVAFSADGSTLVTGQGIGTGRVEGDTLIIGVGSPGSVRSWSVATGKRLGSFTTPTTVNSIVFSPTKADLVAISLQGGVQLWDLDNGKHLADMLTGGEDVGAVAFSPDGSVLASGAGGTVGGRTRLWDMSSGRTKVTLPPTDNVTVAFSPDGRILVTTGDTGVQLWDWATGQLRTALGPGSSVAFSPDGRTLVTGINDRDGTVQRWGAAGWARTALPDTDSGVVEFNPKGRTLATATEIGSTDARPRLWDVKTDKLLAVLDVPVPSPPKHGGVQWAAVYWPVFSPNGQIVAADGFDNRIRLWDAVTGVLRTTLTLPPDASGAVPRGFSPDGRTLAIISETGIRLWDLGTHDSWSLPGTGGSFSVAFNPKDGNILATIDDKSVRLWDLATRKPWTLPGTGSTATTENQMVFSPHGRTLATSGDKGVQLWDLATRKPLGLSGTGTSDILEFSPNGRTLATDGVQLWDTVTGRARSLPGTSSVNDVAFSSNGHTLATDGAGDVSLWDLTTGHVRTTLPGTSSVNDVVFSPDGGTLATTDANGGPVLLWDVALPGPTEAIQKICKVLHRNLTPQEWSRYLPGQSLSPVCPS
ncbi:nSTAND1 domain-containing NTPase [Streptosporangium canum]